MMEQFNQAITLVNDAVWTYLLIGMLLLSAIWFTVKSRFMQVSRLGEMIRLLKESLSTDRKKGVSSFQAFTISLGARVGTGNLAGVATAIAVGGAGAIFWMWVIAFLGAASGFVEATLAQIFKRSDGDHFIGGPAYYMERGLGKRWMGLLFCVFTVLTFGFAFNSVQSNTITFAFQETFGLDRLLCGVGLTALTALIIFGGIHRIAKFSGIVVPAMALCYFALAVYIILTHLDKLPDVLHRIIGGAFGWEQATGGTVGMAIMQGVRRGLFSNEAGMGSAPNAAATAHVSHPVKQGLIQSLGIFVDTLVVCSCTAFIILIAYPSLDSSLTGINLTQAALVNEIGSAGSIFISVAIFFFAFSSIVGNYYYGETNVLFFSKRPIYLLLYRLMVIGMVLFGSIVGLEIVWNMADLTMAFMTITNLIAILLLGKYAFTALTDYLQQRKTGIESPCFSADSIPELSRKLTSWRE